MYPLRPFKLSLPIRQRTSVQSDALRKKESPQGHDFMKWADADSVINIISHVYAYAQHIWIRERRAAKNTSDVSVNRTGTEEVPRRIMKDVSVPPKAEIHSRCIRRHLLFRFEVGGEVLCMMKNMQQPLPVRLPRYVC